MPDGVYFLDCRRGEDVKSTLAFYNNLVPFGNEGELPNTISDIEAGFLIWETGTEQSHRFGDGVTLRWTIATSAASSSPGSVVGSASNGFQSFQVFKDITRVLFKTGDGFECTTVYYAQ